jgi:hypothetical protein
MIFMERRGLLLDEYETLIEDPVAWINKLEPPSHEQLIKEYEMEQLVPYPREPDPEREWRDSEGFRFYTGEFF